MFLKLILAPVPGTNDGVSNRLSDNVEGLSINAALGAENGEVVEVTHIVEPEAFVATQPAGKAGATTASKFSETTLLVAPNV